MMKLKRFLSIIAVYFSFLWMSFSQTPSGIDLCDNVYNQLKEFSSYMTLQSLVSGGTNHFIYNINLTFPSQNGNNSNLIFYFSMEDAFSSMDTIRTLSLQARDGKYPFDVIIILCAGDNQKEIRYENQFYMPVNGSRIFINSLNTNRNYAAVCTKLSSKKTNVITGSMGTTSPTWMVKEAYKDFENAKLGKCIPSIYISELYHLHFFEESPLNDFLMDDIPSILFKFSEEDKNKAGGILCSFMDSYSENLERSWDRHSLMMSFANKHLWLTEYSILKIILCTLILSILFIAFFSLINNNLQKDAWSRIKSCWYTLPLTILVSALSFYLVKGIFFILKINSVNTSNAFSLFGTQISAAVTFLTIFYLFAIRKNRSYTARSIDYLILIGTFINGCLFTLADISLFPILLIICLISVLSIIFKNNILHIILFFCMIIPFIPYTNQLTQNANLENLKTFLFTSRFLPIFFSALTAPFFLLYFRVLMDFCSRFASKKVLSGICIFVAVSIISLTVSGICVSNYMKENNVNQNKIYYENLKPADGDLITLEVKDSRIFDDIVRTINVNLGEQAEFCCVTVSSDKSIPVSYSDNDYISPDSNSSDFTIPPYPPQKMSFSYGTDRDESKITVMAVYKSDNINEYLVRIKTFETGTNK